MVAEFAGILEQKGQKKNACFFIKLFIKYKKVIFL